jgi:hypothetical protein
MISKQALSKRYERRDNDETGTCYSVSENYLKVIVNVKGASGGGKISGVKRRCW